MSADLDRRARDELALAETNPGRDLGAFDVLDIYAEGVAPAEARVEAIATISAGYMTEKGLPARSRDGTIYLHDPEGRAPGLAEALAARDGKSLTITFPFDDPRDFIQQRFVNYSKTRLLAYGDQHSVVTISDQGERQTFDRDTDPDGYAAVVATCKTAFSVYFVLVEWVGDTPVIVMPDGLGFYRIRFTGRNSARSFMGQMKLLTQFTGGRIAGVPFDLRITNREVADPKGMKRTIPVFVPTMKAPGMQLNSTNFRTVLRQSITQAERLQLTPPSPETIEDARVEAVPVDMDDAAVPPARAETEDANVQEIVTYRGGKREVVRTIDLDTGETVDPETGEVFPDRREGSRAEPTEHDLAQLQSALDYDAERARFFATVKGTLLDGDEERADLLMRYFGTEGDWTPDLGDVDVTSLREVIPRVDPSDWDAFLAFVKEEANISAARAIDREPDTFGDGTTRAHTAWLDQQIGRILRVGLRYRDRLAFLGFLLDGRRVGSNADLGPDDFDALRDRLGTTNGRKWSALTIEAARALVDTFDQWRASDETAEGILG